jgi:UDPglucose--hexose-1-phosphate uridylyltransferase
MRVTTSRLADGREISYVDPDGLPPRVAVDTRTLPAVSVRSELRQDPLTGDWVAIAGHRQDRTFLPPAHECPLCPTRPGRPASEIPDSDYEVVVFENRFPSFAPAVPDVAAAIDDGVPAVAALYPRRPGRGRCEVVCFTSDHEASFAGLSVERVRLVMAAWAYRTTALSADPDVAHVFCFENRGREIGVTLAHPHGQIYGYPFVPPRAQRLLDRARAHHDRTGRHLVGDILAAEATAGTRVVASNDAWTAFVPAAARWPVEVHVVPHRQVPDLAALSEEQRAGFAPLYLDVLRGLDRLFGEPLPYIAGWQTAPVRSDRDLGWCHLQLTSIRRSPDKLKYLAGSESAMGAFVNDVLPERQAAAIRASIAATGVGNR